MATLIQLNSFSGGMNRKTSPLLARIDEAYLIRNALLGKVGALQKRKGYKQIGNVPDTNPVRFLYPYYKVGASPVKQFLRISGSKFYYLNETTNTWVDATGSNTLLNTGIPDADTYANLAIIVNATDTSVLKWDGTTLATLGGSPVNGSCIAVMKDRVYIAKDNYVYFSDVADPEKWAAYNQFTVGLNDGDIITALIPYFNSLLIFKRNSIWQYDVDENNERLSLKPLAYGIGTDSWRTCWVINGVLHFASRKGIYQFSGRAPQKISYRIEDIFESIAGSQNFVAWEDGDVYHLFVGKILGYDNVVINYDSILDYFTIYEPFDVKSAQVFINKDDQLKQYFGDSNGKVWQLWEGYSDKADINGANGKAIEMEWESLIYQIGNPTVPFEIDEVAWRMDADLYSPITIEVSADNRDWVRIAEAQTAIGKNPRIHNNIAQAMDIKFRIHEFSTYPGPMVYQIVLNGNMPEESRMLPRKYTK